MPMTREQSEQISITAVAPQQIKSLLLSDGWHEVQQVQFTQFAISPSASPPQPNKFYSALQYTDRSNQKAVVTPLSKVLSFEVSEQR
jgi:hypothetical protein